MIEKPRIFEHAIRTLAIAAVGGLALAGCAQGDNPKLTTTQRQELYTQMSASKTLGDRFRIEFLTGGCVSNPEDTLDYVDCSPYPHGGMGVEERDEMVGSKCLDGSTYDIANGWSTPAALEPDPENNNYATINAATPGQPPLHLDLSPGKTRALDRQTQAILEDNDCGYYQLAG